MLFQASLPINHKTNYKSEALIEGQFNQEICSFINSWPNLQNNHFVALIGENGSGKTHLLHVLEEKTNGLWLQAKHLKSSPRDIIIQGQVYILDDADQIEDLNWLFDFYNVILEKKSFWAISGKNAIKNWPCELKDWYSRLISFLTFYLTLPDDDTIAKVLTKQLYDRGLPIDDQVIRYLLCRIDRSFISIKNTVIALDQASAQQQRRLTIPLLKEILAY